MTFGFLQGIRCFHVLQRNFTNDCLHLLRNVRVLQWHRSLWVYMLGEMKHWRRKWRWKWWKDKFIWYQVFSEDQSFTGEFPVLLVWDTFWVSRHNMINYNMCTHKYICIYIHTYIYIFFNKYMYIGLYVSFLVDTFTVDSRWSILVGNLTLGVF